MPKVGIRDVAKLAGVSTGTVSRVLNDHPSVTDELRARVRGVIEELGYMPDPSARSMRSKVSRLIGIVIPDLTNPFFSELVQSAEQAAAGHGYNIIVMTSFDHAAKEADRIGQLTSRKVDGIILVPSNDFHTLKLPKGLPIVIVDRLLPGYSGIASDHRNGVRIGVEHLLKLGHRRIGFIKGDPNQAASGTRLAGYRRALKDMGLPYDPKLVVNGLFSYRSGLDAADVLLGLADPPTAIFASNDDMAAASVAIAHRRGLEVPRDLTVCGFDDTALATTIWPELTTIRQPVLDMARIALERLVQVIRLRRAGRADEIGQSHIRAEHALIRRQSDAAPPAADA